MSEYITKNICPQCNRKGLVWITYRRDSDFGPLRSWCRECILLKEIAE